MDELKSKLKSIHSFEIQESEQSKEILNDHEVKKIVYKEFDKGTSSFKEISKEERD